MTTDASGREPTYADLDPHAIADPWGDHQSAAVFTFDLDAEELWRALGDVDEGFERMAYRGTYGPQVGVPRILEVFDRHDCLCTFFVPGKVAEEWPAVVQRIHDAGHEVAHHGYSHVSPSKLSPEEEEAEFKRALDVFEDLLGEQPRGYRTVGGMREQTLDLVAAAGMAYDASYLDGDMPYWRPDVDLVELPTHFMLDDFVYWGYNMGPTFEFQSGISPHGPVFDTWEAEFRGLHARQRLFTLTMHPQIVGRASRIDALDELLGRIRETEGAWVTTAAAVADHWQTHH